MKDQQKDIIWILIDTLMIDFLNLNSKKNNYVEKQLLRGKTYTNVITAEKYTLGSFYALGTGLYGAVNGMNGIDYNFSREKPDVLFIGDYLKKLGYNTFHCMDRRYRHFPSSGIDIYELLPYNGITSTYGRTYDTPKRRDFIKNFNKIKSPKFLFLHMFVQHDMLYAIGRKGRVDTSTGYKRTLKYLSKDLSIILKLLKLTGEELLVINTDHGAVLDIDFMKEEVSKGTSMREGNLKTFCTFISPDIKPAIITKRCSTIDILPTIFDLAGLPALPVQGKSLMNTEGTKSPICEGVEVHKYPFNKSCSSAYAIYKDDWKVVIKKDQEKKLYEVNEKIEKEVKKPKGKNVDVIKCLTKKISEDLSLSACEIRAKRITELKSEGVDVLMLKREDLPIRIILFVTEIDIENLDCFIDDMKSQIEHYFDLHLFNVDEKISKKLKEVDTRIKLHEDKLGNGTVLKILNTYHKKPEFVGFVKPSNEYYEDFLYVLRRLLETNPQSDIAYAELEKNSEYVFLARTQLIKKLIDQGIKIKDLSSLQKYAKKHQRVEYKYPLGTIQKKKFTIFPLDNSTIDLLRPEGVDYVQLNRLDGEKIDIIACSNTEKIQNAKKLADLHQAVPVYIDYNCDSAIPSIIPSKSLMVIKRNDYRYWRTMKNETKIISQRNYLWESLEDCINETKVLEKKFKILDSKRILYFTNLLLTKLTYLPIFNSYPIRKLLYSIDIKGFESAGCKNTSVLKRKVSYNKHFDISNLPTTKYSKR